MKSSILTQASTGGIKVLEHTAELQPCFGGFGAVMVHLPSGLTDGDPILANRKAILVLNFDAALFIEVNERDDSLFPAEEIVGHGRICWS